MLPREKKRKNKMLTLLALIIIIKKEVTENKHLTDMGMMTSKQLSFFKPNQSLYTKTKKKKKTNKQQNCLLY